MLTSRLGLKSEVFRLYSSDPHSCSEVKLTVDLWLHASRLQNYPQLMEWAPRHQGWIYVFLHSLWSGSNLQLPERTAFYPFDLKNVLPGHLGHPLHHCTSCRYLIPVNTTENTGLVEYSPLFEISSLGSGCHLLTIQPTNTSFMPSIRFMNIQVGKTVSLSSSSFRRSDN